MTQEHHNRLSRSRGSWAARRLVDNARAVAYCFHLRYTLAYAAAHLLPLFSAGSLIARMYKAAGFEIGKGTSFGGPLRVISGTGFERNLTFGENVLVSTNVTINVDDRVLIEDSVSIGPFVRIYTATHPIGPGSRRMMPTLVGKPVTIERGSWIGLGATILPGVRIGRGSIVGAGSIVAADVPPHTYVEGNPATVVRSLPWGDR